MAHLATLKYPVFIKVDDKFIEVGEVEIPVTVTAGPTRPSSNHRGTEIGTAQISIIPSDGKSKARVSVL